MVDILIYHKTFALDVISENDPRLDFPSKQFLIFALDDISEK